MITIKVERPSKYCIQTKAHFDCVAKPEWFDDPIVKQMIWDIDHSKVISYLSMENDLFGVHSYRELSNGTKTLIMLYKCPDTDPFPIWGAKFGDNCTDWILKLSHIVDRTIYISNIIDFISDESVSDIKLDWDCEPFKNAADLTNRILDRLCVPELSEVINKWPKDRFNDED